MKKSTVITLMLTLFIAISITAQNRGNMNRGVPQTNAAPTEQEIAKQKREMEERKEEYIGHFLTTLEADDFQKQIIKLKLDSYFEEQINIYKTKFEHRIEQKAALEKLKKEHFIELKELISEDDMNKINDLVEGKFNDKDMIKKKKKKKKKND